MRKKHKLSKRIFFISVCSLAFLYGCGSNTPSRSDYNFSSGNSDFSFDYNYDSSELTGTADANMDTDQKEHPRYDVDPSDENYDYRLEPYNGSGVPDELTDEILEKYLRYLEPADDEYDFRYAYDYQELFTTLAGSDACANKPILGYADASLEEIQDALNKNPNISQTYRDFIYQYACDLRAHYPECNLAILKYNLETLIIEEVSPHQMMMEALSDGSAACYLRFENKICVLENLDLSRESDDYIILVHELTHAARTITHDTADGMHISIDFNKYHLLGTYAEEGIITNMAYELQGLGKRADFYPMQSNYYRIIAECIGYDGSDFMNHSIAYLIEEMDRFMGDDNYAYQIVAMIDAQAHLRYKPTTEVDFYDFRPMYEYLITMYCKKHITAEMSYDECLSVFHDFYDNITHYFENMNRKYAIDESTFMPTFEAYLEEMGIL